MSSLDNLKGVVTPVVTLFKNQEFDKEAMGEHIEFLIENGVNGMLFLGTAGEVTHMSKSMREEVTKFCIEKVNKRVPVIIGISARSKEDCVYYGNYAKNCGADALILVNPSYIKYSDEGLYNFYKDVVDAVDMPTLIYNFPTLTGQRIPPCVVLKLAQDCKNIIGIKDTTDSASSTREYINVVKSQVPSFKVFCGFDEYLLNTLHLGGEGAIPGSSNFKPQYTVGLYKAFLNGDSTEQSSFQKKIGALCAIYAMHQPFFPAIKYAMKCTGRDISYEALWPCADLSSDTKEKIKTLVEKL